MTNKKAYQLIELCLDYDKAMSENPKAYEDAIRLAKEVFDKQEPMKPTYDHRYAEMGCSMCGNMVGGWEERPNYCPNCGQAIDWSKE